MYWIVNKDEIIYANKLSEALLLASQTNGAVLRYYKIGFIDKWMIFDIKVTEFFNTSRG